MTRPAIHFTVDVVLFLTFLSVLWTSALLQFVFPPATRADGWQLWGWTYDQWHTASFVCLAVFTLGTLVHLILQWGWICNFLASRITKRKGTRVSIPDGIKTLYGVGTLAATLGVLGILLAVAEIMINGKG